MLSEAVHVFAQDGSSMLARMFSGALPSRRDEKVRLPKLRHEPELPTHPAVAVVRSSRMGRMFSENNLQSETLPAQGRVFLDRDPKHFRLILNYLRDGDACLPNCSMELQEILQEALFYQV